MDARIIPLLSSHSVKNKKWLEKASSTGKPDMFEFMSLTSGKVKLVQSCNVMFFFNNIFQHFSTDFEKCKIFFSQ